MNFKRVLYVTIVYNANATVMLAIVQQQLCLFVSSNETTRVTNKLLFVAAGRGHYSGVWLCSFTQSCSLTHTHQALIDVVWIFVCSVGLMSACTCFSNLVFSNQNVLQCQNHKSESDTFIWHRLILDLMCDMKLISSWTLGDLLSQWTLAVLIQRYHPFSLHWFSTFTGFYVQL